jgi:hypothetical protein
MSDYYSSICLTSVKSTVLNLFGLEKSSGDAPPNEIIMQKYGGSPIDRAVIYNPDAVALWIYMKYTSRFAAAHAVSDIAVPVLSVMPSVTPVCFASMYTGVMPEIHGIRKYEKPVLREETLFDRLLAAGRKCAICSTEGDSISKIFLERDMDYFIYDTDDEVNSKALELIEKGEHDLIVIYNGDYDGAMHRSGPEGEDSLAHLDKNIAVYREIVERIRKYRKGERVFYGFCPDHGCHEIDGGCGSHGLDCEEDMNVIHFYGLSGRR